MICLICDRPILFERNGTLMHICQHLGIEILEMGAGRSPAGVPKACGGPGAYERGFTGGVWAASLGKF